MESLVVECLACGASRVANRDVFKRFEEPECPHCGYLGWALPTEPHDADLRDPTELPRRERLLVPVA